MVPNPACLLLSRHLNCCFTVANEIADEVADDEVEKMARQRIRAFLRDCLGASAKRLSCRAFWRSSWAFGADQRGAPAVPMIMETKPSLRNVAEK